MPVVFLYSTTSLQVLEDSHYWLWDCCSRISKHLQWSSLCQINPNASNSITLPLPYTFLILCQDCTSLSLLLVSLILSSVNNFHSLLSRDPIFCLVFLLLLMNLQNDFLFPLITLLFTNLFYASPFWLYSCLPLLFFCTHLFVHQATAYLLHPSITGVRSMANLWTKQVVLNFSLFYDMTVPSGAKEDEGLREIRLVYHEFAAVEED